MAYGMPVNTNLCDNILFLITILILCSKLHLFILKGMVINEKKMKRLKLWLK